MIHLCNENKSFGMIIDRLGLVISILQIYAPGIKSLVFTQLELMIK